MDSVCAAYCYAELKTLIDPENTYRAVRCGHMNAPTKAAFKDAGITAPSFLKNLRPRVSDIVKTPEQQLHAAEPVYTAVNLLNHRTISILPIFSDEDAYAGILSIDEITGMFMRENSTGRPEYSFRVENFEKVVHGRLLQEGEQQEFSSFIMTGAMPLDISMKRIESLLPKKPLMVVGMRKDLIDHAVLNQFPAIILTGYHEGEDIPYDFSSFRGCVFVSYMDTAETIRLLRLSVPVKNILSHDLPKLQADDLFDDSLECLIDSGYRGLPVFQGDSFLGTVTRRCFIKRPAHKVILVDHNELSQSIPGIEDAQIVEIIDHHRLGAEKTRYPIYIAAAPVGSTCTLVYEQYRKYQQQVPPGTARLLLAGILSDTVILKSPTTTSVDRLVVEQLSQIAGVGDYKKFGEQLYSNTTVITEAVPEKLVEADYKVYTEFGCSFGIGQVEVNTLENVDEVKDSLIQALENIRRAHKLDWSMLLISNVLKENSVLLTTDLPVSEKSFIYKKESSRKFLLPGVLSRKKQLLPEVLRVLEDMS